MNENSMNENFIKDKDKLYILVNDKVDWKNVKIFNSENDAIEALIKIKNTSQNYKKHNYRILIFEKDSDINNFTPINISLKIH